MIKLKISDPIVAANTVFLLFKLRHGEADDYQLVIPGVFLINLLAQQKQTQPIFNIVMAYVAGISLLVGSLGIMHIM